jgi:hypothetical protein
MCRHNIPWDWKMTEMSHDLSLFNHPFRAVWSFPLSKFLQWLLLFQGSISKRETAVFFEF